jgi:hypothetical protein
MLYAHWRTPPNTTHKEAALTGDFCGNQAFSSDPTDGPCNLRAKLTDSGESCWYNARHSQIRLTDGALLGGGFGEVKPP